MVYDIAMNFADEYEYVATSDQVSALVAKMKTEGKGAFVVEFRRQVMGCEMEVHFEVYPITDLEVFKEFLLGGSMWGPQSTCFSLPHFDECEEFVNCEVSETIYMDNDFDSMNSAAFETYYSYHPIP